MLFFIPYSLSFIHRRATSAYASVGWSDSLCFLWRTCAARQEAGCCPACGGRRTTTARRTSGPRPSVSWAALVPLRSACSSNLLSSPPASARRADYFRALRYANFSRYGGFFFRSLRSLKSTGRCVLCSAPAESDLPSAGSGQIRFSLRYGLLLPSSDRRAFLARRYAPCGQYELAHFVVNNQQGSPVTQMVSLC